MEIAQEAIKLLSQAAQVGGAIWAAWGLVVLGTGLKDHNGPGIQSGIWQLVGGLLIVAAGALVAKVDVSLETSAAVDMITTIVKC